MKVIINESQYHQVILNELGNRGKGLLSYISRNYEVMGNSFTPRFGPGEQWFTRNNIADELEIALAQRLLPCRCEACPPSI